MSDFLDAIFSRDLGLIEKYLEENGVPSEHFLHRGLGIAVSEGQLEIVKFLVNRAKVNIRHQYDFCLRKASQIGHMGLIMFLVSEGADIHTLHDYPVRLAAEAGHLEAVQYLHAQGADIFAEDNFALRLAAKYGRQKVVKYLLDAGADIHAKEDEALRECVSDRNRGQRGHLEMIELLLEYKANVNTQKDVIPPLHIAAGRADFEVMTRLLDHGATFDRNTKSFHPSVRQFLLDYEPGLGMKSAAKLF